MFGGYNYIYYEVIASQTSTNCNRLTWCDVVNVKYFCHITVDDLLAPALCVISHSRASAQYSNFIDQAQLLMQKMHREGYVRAEVEFINTQCNGHRHDLIDRY
jgi:hypothetical protein